MKRLLVLTVTVMSLVSVPGITTADSGTSSFVEYQGKMVPVAKTYTNFQDYKNDQNNLTAAQAKHASSLVRKAAFGPRFKDSEALLVALEKLQFPGYGYFFANQVGAKIDPKLEISFVELPKARANRYLVTEVQSDGSYLVVADFIAPSDPEITRVRRGSRGELQYYGTGDNPVLPKKSGT
jgi:hypothetical protein